LEAKIGSCKGAFSCQKGRTVLVGKIIQRPMRPLAGGVYCQQDGPRVLQNARGKKKRNVKPGRGQIGERVLLIAKTERGGGWLGSKKKTSKGDISQ